MSRRSRLVLVLTVALAARIGNVGMISELPVVEYQRTWPDGDMSATWAWSDQILRGDVLCRDTPHPFTAWMQRIAPRETWERWWGGRAIFHRAPLYPYLLAAVRWLFGDGFWGIALCQLALGLVSVALIFLLAERMFGPTVATLAGFGAAVYGPFLLHEALLIRDPVAVTTSLLALWSLARCATARRGSRFVAGVSFAASLLAREANVAFGPLALLWVVRRSGPDARARASGALGFVVGVVVGLLPLIARNVAVGVAPWALSNGAVERVVYFHAVDSGPVSFTLPATASSILHAADGHLGAAVRLTLASYDGDWWRLLRNESTNVAAIFAGFEPADNVNWYYFRERSPFLRFPLRFELVLAAGLVGVWLERRDSARHGILWYFLVAALPGLSAPVVARYRLVAVAVLLIYAGATVVWSVRRARAGRWGAAALAGVATATLAIASARLLPDIAARQRYRSAEFILAAQVYAARDQPEQAFDELREGLVKGYRAPDQRRLSPPRRQMAEGFVAFAHRLGRDAEAAETLERLSAEYTADPDLQHLLGVLYRDGLGRADLAERHLEEERRLR